MLVSISCTNSTEIQRLTETSAEAHNEDNHASQQQHDGDVEQHIVVGVDLYQSSRFEFVEKAVESDSNEQSTEEPEHKVEQENQIFRA